MNIRTLKDLFPIDVEGKGAELLDIITTKIVNIKYPDIQARQVALSIMVLLRKWEDEPKV